MLSRVFDRLKRQPKRVVFAEGEEEQVIRAAAAFVEQGLGTVLLVGRENRVRETAENAGIDLDEGISIVNARLSRRNAEYAAYLYERLQRQRLPDPRLPAHGEPGPQHLRGLHGGDERRRRDGDRRHAQFLGRAGGSAARDRSRSPAIASSAFRWCSRAGAPCVVADTAVTEMPNGPDIAEIAVEAAGVARKLGYEPRVALLSFSTFGHPPGERAAKVQDAVRILDQQRVDFEYDGEMAADVALNPDLMAAYPFCRLSGPANVLVMPAFHSAAISTKMLQELGGATVIGPLLVGLDNSVQIVNLSSKDTDLVNMAALAAYNVSDGESE